MILHVDIDAFFAAVEVLDRPELAGQAVVVGGTGPRGVVASCTYEARRYGVHSAMPTVTARRLCPHAVYLDGSYDRYAAASRRFHEVLGSFSPMVESLGLDEAFVDISGSGTLFGGTDGRPGGDRDRRDEVGWVLQVGEAVRRAVASDTRLACSVGIATSKLLAKLASEEAKPGVTPAGVKPGRGVVVVGPGEELAFLHPMPVGRLWGVGPATRKRLGRLGVRTVGDLSAVPLGALVATLGRGAGAQLHNLAWARDAREVSRVRQVRSIGHEETYAQDLLDRESLGREVVRLASTVGRRLHAARVTGRTVTLKVRSGDFATRTRSRTLPAPTATASVLARVGAELLAALGTSKGVRLLGLSVSGLRPGREGEQLHLGGPTGSRPEERVAEAVEQVKDRFGAAAVGPLVLATGHDAGAGTGARGRFGPSARVVEGSSVRDNGGEVGRPGHGSEGGFRAAFRR